jgi:hypothetical protein
VKKRTIKEASRITWLRLLSTVSIWACVVVAPSVSEGAELKKQTLSSWDNYIQASTAQMQDHLRPNGIFLWVDEVPERSLQVRAGKILVSPVGEQVPKGVDSGLIHDWAGAAFIPGATIADVLDVVRDYDRYPMFYKPNVTDSKTLSIDPTADKFSMLLVNKELVTFALEGEYQACYLQVADKQWYSIGYTTRIQEIRDYGRPGEEKLPPDQGSGFIWRIYSLARFEERDGGVYIEQEAIVLSRDIPTTLRWFVNPIVRRTSKSALRASLQQTKDAVLSRAGVANALGTRGTTSSTCTPTPSPDLWSAARKAPNLVRAFSRP